MSKHTVVLLSSYNGSKYIEEQISSIFNQTEKDIDLYIRDDASKDDTVKLIKEMMESNSRIHLIEGVENLGYKKSFKALIDYLEDNKVEFDYVSFCDQDDYWEPKKIERSIVKIVEKENNKSIPVCYSSNLTIVDQKLNKVGMMHESSPIPKNKYEMLLNGFAYGCTIVLNRQAFDLIKKFDGSDKFAFDFYIPIIVSLFGENIWDIESSILYRQHDNNVIGSKRSFKKLLSEVLYKYSIKYYSSFSKKIIEHYGESLNEADKHIIEQYANTETVSLIFNKKVRKKTLKGTIMLKGMIVLQKF